MSCLRNLFGLFLLRSESNKRDGKYPALSLGFEKSLVAVYEGKKVFSFLKNNESRRGRRMRNA